MARPVPALYDPMLAVSPAGVCLCCQVHLGLSTHRDGCPIKLVEGLRYRVTHNGDRYTPSMHRDDVDLWTGFQGLLGDMEYEEDRVNRILEEVGESAEDWECVFTVEVVGSTDLKVGGMVAPALQVRRENMALREKQQRVIRLLPERTKRLQALEAERGHYTDQGYQFKVDEILNDPKYAELPPPDPT